MSRRVVVSSAVLFFAFTMICLASVGKRGTHSVTADPQAQRQASICSDPKAVVKAIYDLYKKEPLLEDQIIHINVVYHPNKANPNTGVITLYGFAFGPTHGKSDRRGVNLAIKLARQATPCETSVVFRQPGKVLLRTTKGGGCEGNEVLCGTAKPVCIPAGEDCNIP